MLIARRYSLSLRQGSLMEWTALAFVIALSSPTLAQDDIEIEYIPNVISALE
jgi:hypothetical protein